MRNHEINICCLFCDTVFDARIHGTHCPTCGHELHCGEYEFE